MPIDFLYLGHGDGALYQAGIKGLIFVAVGPSVAQSTHAGRLPDASAAQAAWRRSATLAKAWAGLRDHRQSFTPDGHCTE